jgi:hypothetical protein
VTDGDGAAVHVEQFVGDAQPVAAVEQLHRKRLVEFPQRDVRHGEAELLEQPRHGKDGSDPHFVRLGAGDRHADIAAERVQAAALRQLRLHHDAGRSAVGKLAGVARGDGSARHHRLQRRQTFQGRLGPVAPVAVETDFAEAGLVASLGRELRDGAVAGRPARSAAVRPIVC